jgi:hypothetical protein
MKKKRVVKKRKTKLLKRLPQTGKKISRKMDKQRKALPPGKRKTAWGTVYWETRRNRSDKNPKTGL